MSLLIDLASAYTCMGFIFCSNLFMLSGFFYNNPLDRSISIRRVFWLVLLLPRIKTLKFNANNVDSAASDLSLDCLAMVLLCDARHKWINIFIVCVKAFGHV